MQTAALAELGLGGWSYEAIEVAPEHFAALVGSLPDDGFAGVNVTVPHKLAALALAAEASDAAREIGAANTLTLRRRRRGAGRQHRRGRDRRRDRRAARRPPSARARGGRLGAGGGLGASRRAGAEVSIWNRTAAKGRRWQRARRAEVGIAPRSGDFDVLVNATTVGLEQASERPPESG